MSQAIKLWDIHGGIHPAENKSQSNQQPIRVLPLPKKLYLPLQQHIGNPAELTVNVGDRVLKGQRLAEANGFISASLHAPTSGTIVSIEPRQIPHSSGLTAETIIIETDGKEEWCEREVIKDYLHTDPMALLGHIRNHGITGMGGAGFPTSVKLTPKDDDHIDTLVINGAECEPYITSDQLLMRERADQVIDGISVLGQILKPKRCIIGVEDNKMDAVKALRESVEAHPKTLPFEVKVAAIPTKYPSGGEKQLIQILTGKEVPHGSIPADLGIVCQNVGTVAAVAKAVLEGEPLISRITTVTGDAVSDRGNFETLIGTPIQDLLSHCGVDDSKLFRLIMGGPMMGFTLHSTDLPVIKTTNCILAATEQEFPNPAQAQDCIRCGMCAEACPAELLPQQLYWFSRSKEFEKAKHFNLFDCIECGACSFVCPSHIPLVQHFRFAKGGIRQEEQAHIKSEHAKMRFEARQERLAKEEAEKEARRKARAEAAAKAKAEKEAKAKLEADQVTETASQPTGSSVEDDKKAAIAAAVARAKSKKATSTPDSGVDVKALKVASSQARAAHLKAKRALDAAKEAGELSAEQLAEQEAEVSKLQTAYEASKAKLDAAKNGNSTPSAEQATAPAVDVKALKVASSQARAAYLKAQRAYDAAKEEGSEPEEAFNAQLKEIESLQAAFEKAKAALDNAKSGKGAVSPVAPAAQTKDATDPAQTLENKYKQLKVETSQARAAAKQAQKAVDEANEQGKDSEQLKALETVLAEAVQSYEKLNAKKLVLQEKVKLRKAAAASSDANNAEVTAAESTPAKRETSKAAPTETTANTEDPAQKVKELKVAASQSKAAWRKLERELTKAQEAGEDTSELEQQVSAAKTTYEQANEAKTKAMAALDS
ncbi:electron transport complex subunit RsxC [Litoribacillus peritrichatus]|uniref:Ion-translocating oxidoreductase complex subunit C n=1 Tax=Litoribacillus peritrichatus TaxID=718191 RepID=A0ABP7M1W3_9GAMM